MHGLIMNKCRVFKVVTCQERCGVSHLEPENPRELRAISNRVAPTYYR